MVIPLSAQPLRGFKFWGWGWGGGKCRFFMLITRRANFWLLRLRGRCSCFCMISFHLDSNFHHQNNYLWDARPLVRPTGPLGGLNASKFTRIIFVAWISYAWSLNTKISCEIITEQRVIVLQTSNRWVVKPFKPNRWQSICPRVSQWRAINFNRIRPAEILMTSQRQRHMVIDLFPYYGVYISAEIYFHIINSAGSRRTSSSSFIKGVSRSK